MAINEYLRYQNQMKIFQVNLVDLAGFNLDSSFFIYERIFLFDQPLVEHLSSSPFANLSNKLKLFYASIHFWLRSSSVCEDLSIENSNEIKRQFKSIKNRNCLRAFIVALVKCSVVDKCYKTMKHSKNEATEKINSAKQEHDLRFYKKESNLITRCF